MKSTRAFASSCVVILLCGPLAAAGDDAADDLDAEIARLIRQLGSDRWREREAATDRLIEIGLPAMPAVRKAILDPDPEISFRAMSICRRLTERMPELIAAEQEKLQRLRASAQLAFRQGRYEEMARLQETLAGRKDPDPMDVVWLGHAHQLAGDWARAVAAYGRAAGIIEGLLKNELAGKEKEALPLWLKAAPLTAGQMAELRRNLRRQRVSLMTRMARLQRWELKDPEAAAVFFTKAQAGLEAERSPAMAHTRCWLLQESAACWAQAGEIDKGIKAVERARRLAAGARLAGVVRPEDLVRLLAKLPPGRARPTLPSLIPLSPQTPEIVLDLDDPKTAEQAAYRIHSEREGSTHWYFSLLPPPGREFKTIQLECDMEWAAGAKKPFIGTSAYFLAERPISEWLGQLVWPEGQPAGRQPRRRRLDLPDGADWVGLSTFCEKGRQVHRIAVKATFRRRRKPDRDLVERVRLYTEFQPPAGKPTRDGVVVKRREETWIKPGRHVFAYEHPDRPKAFRCVLDLAPADRCGLFVNLDSPFQQAPTNLWMGRRSSWPSWIANSLVQLPDGRWLLAYDGSGRKIMLATSRDLLKWDEPRPMPFSSVFLNKAPSLFVDAGGTVWLAWFSDRLEISTVWSGGGYRLWLSRSRDGRKWSRPVPVPLGVVRAWPPEPVRFVRLRDGRCRVFWRRLAASAASPGKIGDLDSIGLPGPAEIRNVRVAADAEGRMRMLFDAKDRKGVYYSTSADGQSWTEPLRLLHPRRGKDPWRGQLVCRGDRGCLIYEWDNGGYVCPIRLGPKPALGEPVRITNMHVSLNDTTARVTKDGHVVLLVGADSVWRLKARLDDLLPPQNGDTSN